MHIKISKCSKFRSIQLLQIYRFLGTHATVRMNWLQKTNSHSVKKTKIKSLISQMKIIKIRIQDFFFSSSINKIIKDKHPLKNYILALTIQKNGRVGVRYDPPLINNIINNWLTLIILILINNTDFHQYPFCL